MSAIRKSLWTLMLFGWILGIHRGYIALWDSGGSSPCAVYPYKAALLPPAEVSRLADGIAIRDEAQLQFLLTNYFS